jgi:hypothetical protein
VNKKLTKKHIARLEKMLDELDAYEARLQLGVGSPVKGSWRAAKIRDADALRAVLAMITERRAG